MAWAPWFGTATEIVGAPVVDGVGLTRRRKYAWVVDSALTALFVVLVSVNYFVWSLPPIFVISLAVVVPSALPRLHVEGRNVVLTSDDRLWLLRSLNRTPPPEALIGPLDPEQVGGPVGLLRRTFVIAGTKYQVGMFYKKPFQEMLDTARRRPTGSPKS